MAWDSTKSTAADPDNPTADEQTPASEWNEMITYLKARVGDAMFDAYSILYADVDDTPVALTVAASRIVGRKATGGIAAMTKAEVLAILSVADGATKYPDTGEQAFLDADHTKLNGITALADVTADNAPQAHNQSAATITSGTLPTSRGGTGVTGDTYDADKVDGCDAGILEGNVYKIGSVSQGNIFYVTGTSQMYYLAPGTNGYQLTTHAAGNDPSWAASSDLIFSDTHCPKCGLEFQDGDDLILHVIGHNEVGDLLTLPMHLSCANAPKKTVMIKRKVMEDQYILDELTGKPKVQRVQKMQEKTVTKHKMKEGYVLDNKSGKALKIDKDGKQGKIKYNLADALETVEETISEVVYEDVEFEL